MRLFSGLTLVAFCLTLAGCALTQRSRGTSTTRTSAGAQPFLGTPEAKETETTAGGSAGAADTLASKGAGKPKGILAGQVLDSTRRRVPGALIQVVELDAPRDGAAPLSVLTSKDGWFDVAGLEVGRWYRLVARARSGDRYLTGSTRVQCTNIRVAIALTGEELIPPPSPPPSGDVQSKADEARGESVRVEDARVESIREDHEEKLARPAASQGSPFVKPTTEGVTTPLTEEERPVPASPSKASPNAAPAFPPPVLNGDASNMAINNRDGFAHQAPIGSIPGPGQDSPRKKPITPREPLPPPPMSSGDDEPLAPSTAPSAAPTPAPPSPAPTKRQTSEAALPTRLVVPSCVRVGQKVEDFALYDSDGNVWELSKKRSRTSRLVLLDFWSTGCAPCRDALRYVAMLDAKYRKKGLDVVGIANEEGTFLEKQELVRQARSQYRLDYPLLLAGGGTGSCPVLRQFEVHELPTLILLDRSGKIVWKARGLDQHSKYALEMDIRRRLGIR